MKVLLKHCNIVVAGQTSFFISLCILRDLPQQKIPRELCNRGDPATFLCSDVPMERFFDGTDQENSNLCNFAANKKFKKAQLESLSSSSTPTFDETLPNLIITFEHARATITTGQRIVYPLLIGVVWDSTVILLAKFRHEKYDFNIFKGFSWKLFSQIRQIFECFFQSAIFFMRSSIR